MGRIEWDKTGEKKFAMGVDRGVLYLPNTQGLYNMGLAWNGWTNMSENPSGAEETVLWADNIKYGSLRSREEFGATLEAYTYPDEFAECDGSASPTPGMKISQQKRKSFGLSYRTKLGNDIEGDDYGYELHLIYGCSANPSERAYGTINDSPEAITFSWELTTIPVEVGTINGVTYKPTSVITLNSTKINEDKMKAIENILYGTETTEPRLPLPAEIYRILTSTAPSSEKKITSFVINDVDGVIDETNHTVSVSLPSGTEVTALEPTVVVSAGATVSPASGVAKDFTSPVTYTVTAEDETTQDYVVTVAVLMERNKKDDFKKTNLK